MKLLLADDHGLFRDGMAAWLEQVDKAVEITLADDLISTQRALASTSFDLVFLDLYMPQMKGTTSISDLCEKYPGIKIIIVTAEENLEVIARYIAAGAKGYVSKAASGDEVIIALETVVNGGEYLPVEILDIELLHQNNSPVLTKTQKNILVLIAEGKSNREIAAKLFLSEGTVKQYVTKLLRVLDVDNRFQASLKAAEIFNLRSF